jgi:hypothetical protein
MTKINVNHEGTVSKGIVKRQPYLKYNYYGAFLAYRYIVRFIL